MGAAAIMLLLVLPSEFTPGLLRSQGCFPLSHGRAVAMVHQREALGGTDQGLCQGSVDKVALVMFIWMYPTWLCQAEISRLLSHEVVPRIVQVHIFGSSWRALRKPHCSHLSKASILFPSPLSSHYPLDFPPEACKKSLEAAERSQRANIAEALRAKLAKLEAEQGISKPKGGNKEGCKKGSTKAKFTKVGVEDGTKALDDAKVKTVKKLKKKKVSKKSTNNLPEDPPKLGPAQVAPNAAPAGQSPTSSRKSKGLRSKESNQSKSALVSPKRLKQRKGKKSVSSNDEIFAGGGWESHRK